MMVVAVIAMLMISAFRMRVAVLSGCMIRVVMESVGVTMTVLMPMLVSMAGFVAMRVCVAVLVGVLATSLDLRLAFRSRRRRISFLSPFDADRREVFLFRRAVGLRCLGKCCG